MAHMTLAAGALGTAAIAVAVTAAPIDYHDASTGLQNPAMEAGDTEFEFGDVNGDGHLDAAYGMHHAWSGEDFGDQLLEVALGDGTGAGWTAWDDGLATNGETWGMFATDFADVDNDGDLDVGSNSFGCCAGIHVYLNGGDGTWTQSFGFTEGNAGSQFEFGDVNGDGNADIAASNGAGTVYLGDGAGGFVGADTDLPGPAWRRGLDLGDVNDDGADDLAWAAATGIEVWTRGNDGQWQSRSGILATIGEFDRVRVADMNGDGHGDVLAFRPGGVNLYTGDGTGGWTPAASIVPPDACDHAAFRAGTDVDHNGFPDLVIVSEENCQPFTGGSNRPRVYVESSVPESAFVTPAAPLPGATLVAGSVRFVDWHAGIPAAAAPGTHTMSIDLSTRGPDGPWSPVATAAPDNGRFQWSLAPGLRSSSDCFLRYTLDTDPPSVALTPGAFTIVGGRVAGDVNDDGVVDFADLLLVLAAWGPCPPQGECEEDVDGSGTVDFADLLTVIANWG